MATGRWGSCAHRVYKLGLVMMERGHGPNRRGGRVSPQIEPIQIHHLPPRSDEVTHEGLP